MSLNARLITWVLLVAVVGISIETAISIAAVRPNQVYFSVDPGTITFPHGKSGLTFDTSNCVECQKNLPPWRFLGDLKVDSTVWKGKTSPLVEMDEMQGIAIKSSALLSAMKLLRCKAIVKSCSECYPEDTLYWDPITETQQRLHDLSRSFELYYTANISLDSAIDLVRKASGVVDACAVPIPEADVFEKGE